MADTFTKLDILFSNSIIDASLATKELLVNEIPTWAFFNEFKSLKFLPVTATFPKHESSSTIENLSLDVILPNIKCL